jgi:flagellar biosynthetic protein FliR
MAVARFGAQIFIYGLQLALPIVASLLITNIALGVLTRAAQQLNIFSIGLPVTILSGLITIFFFTFYG